MSILICRYCTKQVVVDEAAHHALDKWDEMLSHLDEEHPGWIERTAEEISADARNLCQ